MTSDSNCPFCRQEEMKHSLQDGTSCRRDIYEDEYSLAILSPEQYTIGHTLLILRDHKADITDDISSSHLSAFINAIHEVAVRLKKSARNSRDEHPERIYVCILCDGVEHLHAHLIPRYPFTQEDEGTYREIFTARDGEEETGRAIEEGTLGGYWCIAEWEKKWKHSDFGRRPNSEKARFLEKLANQLRDA